MPAFTQLPASFCIICFSVMLSPSEGLTLELVQPKPSYLESSATSSSFVDQGASPYSMRSLKRRPSPPHDFNNIFQVAHSRAMLQHPHAFTSFPNHHNQSLPSFYDSPSPLHINRHFFPLYNPPFSMQLSALATSPSAEPQVAEAPLRTICISKLTGRNEWVRLNGHRGLFHWIEVLSFTKSNSTFKTLSRGKSKKIYLCFYRYNCWTLRWRFTTSKVTKKDRGQHDAGTVFFVSQKWDSFIENEFFLQRFQGYPTARSSKSSTSSARSVASPSSAGLEASSPVPHPPKERRRRRQVRPDKMRY